jgi:hypothetical protein
VHRQVSEPLLELRAPLVRQLLQVAELAPRLVPLTLLLELRVQLVLLDRTPLCSEAACWPFARAENLFRFRINLGDETKPQRYFFKSLSGVWCVLIPNFCI